MTIIGEEARAEVKEKVESHMLQDKIFDETRGKMREEVEEENAKLFVKIT